MIVSKKFDCSDLENIINYSNDQGEDSTKKREEIQEEDANRSSLFFPF